MTPDRDAGASRAGVATPPAGQGFVSPDTTIDLTNCDREPIHIPGAVQPHGALLVLREPDLTILQASANAGEFLGVPVERLLGTELADLVGATQAESVLAPLRRGDSRAYDAITLSVGNGGGERTFDGVVHRSDGAILLELERPTGDAQLSYADFYKIVRETMSHVENADTIVDLAAAIAEQMRQLTGFDRVWVYRFHEDWHGEIIGEAKRDDIETWLGMHYPASDIPAQARALFLRHWLRMIPDVHSGRVPLVPQDNPLTGAPLDMGGTVLRSVSPIHIQYLENMGVRASLVVSLIKGGRLWGLISGHHYSGPRYVPYSMRTLCEFLAQAFSTQLGMAERVESREYALRLREVQSKILARTAGDQNWVRAVTRGKPTLLELTGATGAAVVVGDVLSTVGETPSQDDIRALVRWLAAREESAGDAGETIFSTAALGAHYPGAVPLADRVSGLIAAHVSATKPDYVLWFRGESRQRVKWAGDPRKPVALAEDGTLRLSPRGSFELWQEEVRGTAAPWTESELAAAAEFRGTVIDILLRRADEIVALNAELERALDSERTARGEAQRAREDAEAANKAKSDFLAMMSHELRTPLNAIGGYTQLLQLGLRGQTTPEQLADYERIRSNQQHLLGLINSILNFARLEAGQVQITLTDVPTAKVLGAIEALVSPQMMEKGLTYAWDACGADAGSDAPARVRADEEKLRQVILNLVSNAIKFTDAGGRIEVGCAHERDTVAIHVRDTGRGIAPDRLATIFDPFVQVDRHLTVESQQGVGLGLAISRDLARKMGGDLKAESEVGKGSVFTLTLPRA